MLLSEKPQFDAGLSSLFQGFFGAKGSEVGVVCFQFACMDFLKVEIRACLQFLHAVM